MPPPTVTIVQFFKHILGAIQALPDDGERTVDKLGCGLPSWPSICTLNLFQFLCLLPKPFLDKTEKGSLGRPGPFLVSSTCFLPRPFHDRVCP